MKILYVDVPFIGLKGGDKNRSRFLWSILSKNYSADLMIISDSEEKDKYSGCNNFYTLKNKKCSFFDPESVYCFENSGLRKFEKIIKDNSYDVVFFRFSSTTRLAKTVKNISPRTQIFVDVDMLLSRISEQSWTQDKSIHNRFYFLEMNRLKFYERKLFNEDYIFLFTNSLEKKMIEDKFSDGKGKFDILPNVMENIEYKNNAEKENYILFFGALNSSANQDAFKFLMDEIYDKILNGLISHDVYIKVVGKNVTGIYRNNQDKEKLQIVGPVDDIYDVIQKAKFILLPLRVASGTRTRILEAAALKQLIITTSVGVEGLDFGDGEILTSDSAQGLIDLTLKALDNKFDSNAFGERIYEKSKMLYSEKSVENRITSLINNCSEK